MFTQFFYGKVSDNKDPDSLNRVRVTMIGEKESVSDWIPVVTPFAGPDCGISILPEIDDMVLVVSMDGNHIKKAVIGSAWFSGGEPPVTDENTDADLNQDGKNNLKFIKSRSGNMLILDDTEGDEKIQIISSDGKSRFEFLNADEMINVETELDIVIGAKGNISIQAEAIEITSKKQINMTGEDIQISAKKTMDIIADKEMTIKGSGIALN
ncbi:MAG: phage baseplate assembly protein V [Treponema sp.]|jgi:uncharacterized protein involved in type VI secretion and phage assembly|nr:phage baseplate assembly protein V [Treponema sp.]